MSQDQEKWHDLSCGLRTSIRLGCTCQSTDETTRLLAGKNGERLLESVAEFLVVSQDAEQVCPHCGVEDGYHTVDCAHWPVKLAQQAAPQREAAGDEPSIFDVITGTAGNDIGPTHVYSSAAPSLPGGDGLTDEQILRIASQSVGVDVDRLGYEHVKFARAILAVPRQPGEVGAGVPDAEDLKYKAELYDEVWKKARDLGYSNVTMALSALRIRKQADSAASAQQDERQCTCGGGALSGSHSRACPAFDESMMRYDPFGLAAQQDEREAKHAVKAVEQLCAEIKQSLDIIDKRNGGACGATEAIHDKADAIVSILSAAQQVQADVKQDERKARSTAERRAWEDGEGRWEVGFRNIVTVLGGARESFEIKEIVEAVRVMTGEQAQGPTPAWWQPAQPNSEDNVFDWLETELSAVDCVYRGSPTYDHDAYWFREKAIALVAEARKVFGQQVQADAAAELTKQRDEARRQRGEWQDIAAKFEAELVGLRASTPIQADAGAADIASIMELADEYAEYEAGAVCATSEEQRLGGVAHRERLERAIMTLLYTRPAAESDKREVTERVWAFVEYVAKPLHKNGAILREQAQALLDSRAAMSREQSGGDRG